MTEQDFLELKNLITIAHHVPGRIRLKLNLRILQHPAAKALASLSGGKPEVGLLSARLNPLAQSLVLEYDTSKISPETLDDFLTSSDIAHVTTLARSVAALLGIQLTTG